MQTINQEPNSNTKPETSDAVTPPKNISGNTLEKIIEAGHILTVDELAKLS